MGLGTFFVYLVTNYTNFNNYCACTYKNHLKFIHGRRKSRQIMITASENTTPNHLNQVKLAKNQDKPANPHKIQVSFIRGTTKKHGIVINQVKSPPRRPKILGLTHRYLFILDIPDIFNRFYHKVVASISCTYKFCHS